jgi:carbamoyltransferase
VLEEQAHRFFDLAPGERLPFMVMVPQVRPEWRDRLPGITHRDGSARVQTVPQDAGAYRILLEELERCLGIPMVLNTSFNVRGEPIVTTPGEAYDCFCRTGIDALVLGRCLITEKPSAVDYALEAKRSVALEGGGP